MLFEFILLLSLDIKLISEGTSALDPVPYSLGKFFVRFVCRRVAMFNVSLLLSIIVGIGAAFRHIELEIVFAIWLPDVFIACPIFNHPTRNFESFL